MAALARRQAMVEGEIQIWEGRPSPAKDMGYHLLCLILSPLIVPLGFMLRRYLDTRFHLYGITSERLRVTTGILTKDMRELELYRVQETSIHQPFYLRVFGLADVRVTIADPEKTTVVIHAIPRASELRESLRECIETMRDRKHVNEAA
jgi:uncharacterized membrane protein YdbT with pleckstrin-like domain